MINVNFRLTNENVLPVGYDKENVRDNINVHLGERSNPYV